MLLDDVDPTPTPVVLLQRLDLIISPWLLVGLRTFRKPGVEGGRHCRVGGLHGTASKGAWFREERGRGRDDGR